VEVSWEKPLYWNRSLRKTFTSWAVPKDIRDQYLIKDGDKLKVDIHLGQNTISGCFHVSSGGELQVNATIGAQIGEYARGNNAESISFSTSSLPLPLGDIDELQTKLGDVSETTRTAIIAARIGQGLFRQRLFKVYHGRCAITGIDVPELLRASHIKPWCDSNDDERLCAENGLLLVADLDAAFDAKLISFKDNGEIIFSPRLGETPYDVLRIPKRSKLTQQPSNRKIGYLKLHRKGADL
jgi:hypothetical protein